MRNKTKDFLMNLTIFLIIISIVVGVTIIVLNHLGTEVAVNCYNCTNLLSVNMGGLS